MITTGTDEKNLVTLHGNTRPEAMAWNDRGRLADATALDHMFLLLQRSPEREQALETTIDQLHSPSSANFHHWLTPEQFGANYGVAQTDIDVIKGWLESHGFAVNNIYPSRIMIDFSGTAGQVRTAFHTEMHQLEVNGEKHISNMSDPQIPAALALAVVGVVSLNDFRPRKMMKRVDHKKFTFGSACGFLTGFRDASSNCEAVMPADLATIYNFNPLFAAGISGQGQTIVVIEDEDAYSLGDWGVFRKAAGLARAYPFTTVSQTHPAPPTGPNSCVVHVTLITPPTTRWRSTWSGPARPLRMRRFKWPPVKTRARLSGADRSSEYTQRPGRQHDRTSGHQHQLG